MITQNYKESNGYSWDKIKLSNGVIGYVADKYLTQCENTKKEDEDKVIGTAKTTDNLKLRKSATTSSVMLTQIPKGKQVDILQKDVGNSDGYTWYKVQYGSYKGYVASKYLTIEEKSDDNKNDETTINNEYAKVIDNILIITPKSNLNNISSAEAKGDLQTGGTIKIKDNTYTVAMLGDANGDGKINSADLLIIVKYLKGNNELNNSEEKASDVNIDEKINSADLLTIVKYLKGNLEISL